MSRFRNRTPPWQYLRAFQIDGIAAYQDLAAKDVQLKLGFDGCCNFLVGDEASDVLDLLPISGDEHAAGIP